MAEGLPVASIRLVIKRIPAPNSIEKIVMNFSSAKT
jgi:hypothetical protein